MTDLDLSKYLVIVHDAPDNMMATELAQWLAACGLTWRPHNARDRHNDCQTNSGIVKALTQKKFDHFVFVENDIRPDVPHTKAFWTCEADIVGCRYPVEQDTAWDNPHWIHAGLWRTTRKVLAAIEPPWFAWRFNKLRTKTIGCLCRTFCEKALTAGFTIEQAGYAMHHPRPTHAACFGNI